jgi:hypothetical protein
LGGLLLAVNALPQTAQTPSQGAAGAIIQGTVRGAGGVLKGAQVGLQRVDAPASTGARPRRGSAEKDSATALTDNNGQFLFKNVPPGAYRLTADHIGYLHQEYGQRAYNGPGAIVTITAGQGTTVEFQLLSTGSISGRIFNEDREPIAGVQVMALTYTYQHGKRTLTAMGEGSHTDDRGAYRLYWLTPGDYYVKAIAPAPIESLSQSSHSSYPPTYFAGQLNPDQASPVSLTPGAEISGIDFTVLPVSTVTVSGQLLLPPSVALAAPAPAPKHPQPQPGAQPAGPGAPRGAQVSLSLIPVGGGRGAGDGSKRASAGADGAFEIAEVIPGSYYLVAETRVGEQQYFARMRLDVGELGINGVSMPLRPGISVPGKISLDGQPPSAFQMGQVRVSLTTSDELLGASGRAAPVSGDGTFTLTNVPPMDYRVRVAGLPDGAYLMAARVGGADALEQPFVVTGDSLQLRISFNAGQVQGGVLDASGNPVSGVLAALVPDGNRRQRPDLFFSTQTDETGHFNFAGVPPGSYKVFAWEDIPDGACQDPDFIRHYEDRGKSVEAEAGRLVSVDVSLIPRGN